jgi:hypothetical protein
VTEQRGFMGQLVDFEYSEHIFRQNEHYPTKTIHPICTYKLMKDRSWLNIRKEFFSQRVPSNPLSGLSGTPIML